MNRTRSAHMADVKGKGICYDDDDGPIQLTDRGDSPLIRDYRLSLIGKILNPKKQTVVKLLQTMPAQWKMQDRITENDLGNGKFLLNFSKEEDLLSVLRQGPFHYNFCMFFLVRWEPVVHDDYPWVIPFWVEITGIPLHLWTIRNLEDIGRRLGHIDTVELTAGRMLIDVDTRKPLTFTRKIASPEGEEVSIQIHYEKLFKHCSTCRLLTHETAHCPTKNSDSTGQNGRTGVFARVQIPVDEDFRQSSLRIRSSPLLYDRELVQRGHAGAVRNHVSSRHSSRYVPYEKKQSQAWRAKVVEEAHVVSTRSEQESYARSSPPDRVAKSVTEMMDHPYPQNSGKRLASQVVTPNGVDQDVNVTKRRRDVTRVLSFSPKEDVLPMDAQVIDALNDMEILESSKLKDGMMMIDDQEDDLLGDELMELESEGHKEVEVTHKEYNVGTERDTASFNNLSGTEVSSSHKGGRRLGIPLGLPNRKAEFLRRGSPKLRGSKVREIHRSGKQHRSSTSKASGTTRKSHGLEGSKISSKLSP
ncbi:hypothetical protein Bca4012_026758 [Brassica carinata]